MKYIKIIVLLLSITLLSGCTINYELELGSKNSEAITFTNTNMSLNKEIPINIDDYYSTFELQEKASGVNYYKKTINQNYTKYETSLNNNDIEKSTACNLMFEKCVFINTESNKYMLSTTTGTSVFDDYSSLDSVIINITVNGEVSKNNADSIDGNVYTWVINRNNQSEKNILLEYSSNNQGKIGNDEKEEDKKIENIIYLGILLIVLLGLAIVVIIANKKKYKQ
ncbi:MAG: hypothetical protein J5892_02625 [Bacilli bacterium]|nr:hypothetical protein [Bacilli bacterium]